MRAFKAAVITLEIGFLIAAFCGLLIAASDRIEADRKRAEQVRQYNASVEAMERIQKERPR